MRKLLAVFLGVTLFSCGVKEPSISGSSPQVGTGGVEEVLVSAEKKFLFHPSRLDCTVDPQFGVTYQIVDRNLEDLGAGIALKVKYSMPEKMPQMPVTAAKIERVGPSKFRVTYDLSMVGKWEFLLSLEEGTQVVDSLKSTCEIAAAP